MKDVEVQTCGEFCCSECGRNSFFDWENLDPDLYSEEELEEYREIFDLDDDDLLDAIFVEPDVVECDFCDTMFEVCNNEDGDCTHDLETTSTWQAGSFSCPKCNETSYFSLTTLEDEPAEVDEEGCADICCDCQAELGMGKICLMPDVLVCAHCGEEYSPMVDEDYDEFDEDEEDD